MRRFGLGLYLLGLPFFLFICIILVWPMGETQRYVSSHSTGWISLSDSTGADIAYEQKLQTKILADKRVELATNAVNGAENEKARIKAVAWLAKAQKQWRAAAKALQDVSNGKPVLLSNTILFGPAHPELVLLLIVIIAGALGSSIFTARSFAYHIGAGDFKDSFIWWYFLRLPVGIGIAFILYIVLRGGLFSGSFSGEQDATKSINPYGFAALSALSGMFSKQATDKLAEIFDNVFRTEPKTANAPKIKRFGVKKLKKGASGAELKIKIEGSNFTARSKVLANGSARATEYTNESTLQFQLKPEDVKKPGKLLIIVKNSPGEGGNSEPVELTVTP